MRRQKIYMLIFVFRFEESDVCRFSIDAPVSTLPTCDDDLITYLNKGNSVWIWLCLRTWRTGYQEQLTEYYSYHVVCRLFGRWVFMLCRFKFWTKIAKKQQFHANISFFKNMSIKWLQKGGVKSLGVNFYKAARLEPPPTFQTPRLSGFWAPPPTFLSHATPIMKLSSVVYRTIKWLQMIFMPIRPSVSFESSNGSCKL